MQFQRANFSCATGIEVCHCFQGILGSWNIVEWQSNFWYLVDSSDSINFFQNPLLFASSADQIVAVWIRSRSVSLGAVKRFIAKCKSHFLILQGLLFYFNSFFMFSVEATDFMASVWHWGVSLQVGRFGILIYSKMHSAFLSISWYHLMLLQFF